MDPDLDRVRLPAPDRQRLSFLIEAHGLTAVQRVNLLIDGSRRENSAEHSWHLALTALVLRAHAGPTVRVERVIEMLLIHDVLEVDAGDIPFDDEAGRAAAAETEARAARRLFGLLPEPDASAYLSLWREFETGETDDARFARALDRIQPLVLHWAGEGAGWRARAITEQQELRVLRVIEENWPPLLPFARALIDDAVERGMLRRD